MLYITILSYIKQNCIKASEYGCTLWILQLDVLFKATIALELCQSWITLLQYFERLFLLHFIIVRPRTILSLKYHYYIHTLLYSSQALQQKYSFTFPSKCENKYIWK